MPGGKRDGFTSEQRWFFDTAGFVVLPDVLSHEEVAELNRACEAAPVVGGHDVEIERVLATEPSLRGLMAHPGVAPILEEILDEGYRLDHLYGIRMRAGDGGRALHGGATPFDPSTAYEIRDGEIFC